MMKFKFKAFPSKFCVIIIINEPATI
jgi:hypothetical protein